MKVFLGGTMNKSQWREQMIPNLECDYFNPMVDSWDEKAQKEEERQKKLCDYLLFVLTPRMKGVFSIAEVVDASNKSPERTIFCILDEDDGHVWSKIQLKSLKAVEKLVRANGAMVFDSLGEITDFLNEKG